MKVGLISPPWLAVPPPAYGGSESVIDQLARGLAAAGHDVLLAAAGGSSCPVPQVNPIAEPATERMGESIVELSYVVRAYQELGDVGSGGTGVDIVHDHTLAGPMSVCRPRKIPVVTTNHGPFDDGFLDIYRAVSRDVHVVAISVSQASLARGVRIARVIHHGLDIDQVPVGTGAGDYLLFLGRMAPEKGPREAVLAARRAGVPLLLAGKMHSGEERRYFAERVEPLLGGDVQYIGELDRAESYRVLGEAAALLNPIQWAEPFGLVMIEALACGTPVVATPCGSAPELIDDGETGFLREGIDELAAAVHQVGGIDRGACRRAAESRFSTDRMVAEHIRLYEDILADRASATW